MTPLLVFRWLATVATHGVCRRQYRRSTAISCICCPRHLQEQHTDDAICREGASFGGGSFVRYTNYIIYYMHVLRTHTMHKRTMLNLASSSGGTPMPTPHSLCMGCHLQGHDKDQSLHHHHLHHASNCWQHSLASAQSSKNLLLSQIHVFIICIYAEATRHSIYIYIHTNRWHQFLFLSFYTDNIWVCIYILNIYIYMDNWVLFANRKQASV